MPSMRFDEHYVALKLFLDKLHRHKMSTTSNQLTSIQRLAPLCDYLDAETQSIISPNFTMRCSLSTLIDGNPRCLLEPYEVEELLTTAKYDIFILDLSHRCTCGTDLY